MAELGRVSAGIWQYAHVFIYLLYVTEGFNTANSRELYNFLPDPIFRVPHFSHCLVTMQLTYLPTGITEITELRKSRQGSKQNLTQPKTELIRNVRD
jgi:hypothetical protein